MESTNAYWATLVEVWCHDGLDVYSVAANSLTWKKIDDLLIPSDNANDLAQYKNIQKFPTGLTNAWAIAEIDLPVWKRGWLGCKVILAGDRDYSNIKTFMPGGKFGFNIVDPSQQICNKKCTTCQA